MFPIMCSVSTHGGVRKNAMNVYSFHNAGDYCTAESEKGDTGVTVSVGSVFSFYGVEDYCMSIKHFEALLGPLWGPREGISGGVHAAQGPSSYARAQNMLKCATTRAITSKARRFPTCTSATCHARAHLPLTSAPDADVVVINGCRRRGRPARAPTSQAAPLVDLLCAKTCQRVRESGSAT